MSSTAVLHRIDPAEQARRLRDAYGSGPIPPLRLDLPDATIEDAYAIQAMNTRHWLDQGRKRAGAKIGLTSKAVQTQLGVDQPDFGVLFEDMRIVDGGEIDTAALLQPKIEAEVAFVLAATPDTSSFEGLVGSIRHARAALEIVDSRIADWNIGIVDTVADNASSALYVLGETEVALDKVDLRLCGMVMEKNGEPVSLGVGAACLGNPLHALRWLADTLARLGDPLRAGDLVLAGALGPMVPAVAGDAFQASIAGLGDVSVRFA